MFSPFYLQIQLALTRDAWRPVIWVLSWTAMGLDSFGARLSLHRPVLSLIGLCSFRHMHLTNFQPLLLPSFDWYVPCLTIYALSHHHSTARNGRTFSSVCSQCRIYLATMALSFSAFHVQYQLFSLRNPAVANAVFTPRAFDIPSAGLKELWASVNPSVSASARFLSLL